VRPLDRTDAAEVAGTENATMPFWSADSRSIGFFSDGKLKIVSLDGGDPKDLCNVESPKGGSWNQDNIILFAQTNVSGLFRISASGGEPVPVTQLNQSLGEWTHRFPQFLPDGKHFFYWIGSPQESYEGEFVGSLDSTLKKRLRNDVNKIQYVSPGIGLFAVQGRLMAQPFDATRLEFQEQAVQLVNKVESARLYVPALFSASETNILGYRDTAGVWASRPAWFDRTGRPLEKSNLPLSFAREPDYYKFTDLSGNEKFLMLETTSGNGLWILNLLTNQFTRFAITNDGRTIFSQDGSHVIYSENTEDGFNVNQRSVDGSGEAELLFRSSQKMDEPGLSADGRSLIFTNFDPTTKFDIWVFPFFGDRKPFPYLQTHAKEEDARVSPNGKWIAYVSDESGMPQVYVRTFPLESGSKWQISFEGGQQPEWRTDGQEMFYMTLDKKLMAVDVKTTATFQAGTPHLLFKTSASPNLATHSDNQQYYATENGQRFLINTIVPSEVPAQITIILNWQTLMKEQ
jgi:Tol biopolymer transport system component